jgi:hypothetical protein
MKLGTVKSGLISKIGYEGTTMRVLYTDGACFDYFKVPVTTFRVLVRSNHPGSDWLKIRDQYKHKEV